MPNVRTAEPGPWTLLALVRWTTDFFGGHGIDNARSEAEILLAHALGLRRIDLYLNHDQPLCESELARFKALIRRRASGEPVAYITGRREFWSLELAVNPAVLIPRPETECLVEAVLPFLDATAVPPKQVLDLGTGSGAIVIALAHECPRHRYMAVDRCPAALATARENAQRHGVADRINWTCSDWDGALAPGRARFDLIVSNPPYIPSAQIGRLQADVRDYEPRVALDGSEDGLACLRYIIGAARCFLVPGGLLGLEMGFDQGTAVRAIVRDAAEYADFRIVKDYSGHDRVALMNWMPT